MHPYTKKLFGLVGLGTLAVFEGALIVAGQIGLTTTGDDAQEKLPALLLWLVQTPWWVPAFVIPAVLLAIALWAFAPDRSVQKAMGEYRAANERSWAFEPEFRDHIETMAARERQLDALAGRQEKMHTELMRELGTLKADLHKSLTEDLSAYARSHVEAVLGNVNQTIMGMVNEAVSQAMHSYYKELRNQHPNIPIPSPVPPAQPQSPEGTE